MGQRRGAAAAAISAIWLVGCQGEAEEKLNEALAGIATVAIGDENVAATCQNQEAASVPSADLEMNFLGMATPEGVQKVASALKSACESKVADKKEAEGDLLRFGDECKRLKLTCGEGLEQMRQALCTHLAAELPLRGERRDRSIVANERNWGCGDPGAPQIGATGFWEIDVEGKKRRAVVSLKLESNDDDKRDGFARLTLRCNRGKLEGYVAETFALKKTKTLVAQADKKKAKWKAAMSTDKKALFLKDAKGAIGDMRGKSKLVLSYQDAKRKNVARVFDIKGIDAAVKKLDGCRL